MTPASMKPDKNDMDLTQPNLIKSILRYPILAMQHDNPVVSCFNGQRRFQVRGKQGNTDGGEESNPGLGSQGN